MTAMPDRTKRLHWTTALTVVRLRETGGLLENDVLEAPKITLHPPSSPAAASPDLIGRVRTYMSEEDGPERHARNILSTREMLRPPWP